MSSKRDPSRPRINEEAAGILRAAAKVAEQRIKERFPRKEGCLRRQRVQGNDTL